MDDFTLKGAYAQILQLLSNTESQRQTMAEVAKKIKNDAEREMDKADALSKIFEALSKQPTEEPFGVYTVSFGEQLRGFRYLSENTNGQISKDIQEYTIEPIIVIDKWVDIGAYNYKTYKVKISFDFKNT